MPGQDTPADSSDAYVGGGLEALAALGGVAIPGGGPLFQHIARRVREEWQRKASTALRRAEEVTGLTREDLTEEIAQDPQLVPLAARLLHAAGMNGHDRTLQAMGAALGDAVNRRESIGECELILTALSDLTDSHAAVLAVVAQEAPGETEGERQAGWTPEALAVASGLPDRVVTLCAAALVARGLARMPGAVLDGGSTYEITELGRIVLEVLDLYIAD